MNFDFLTTRAMELVGVRKLSVFSARLFGVPHPPPVSADRATLTWTKDEFIAFRHDARYSLVANGIRAVLTVPLVYATFQVEAGWIPYFTSAVLGLHLMIILVDGYRLNLAHELEPYAKPNNPHPRRSPAITFKTSGYFKPKPFENEILYRWLGLEWFRKVVVWFVEAAKVSKAEKERGEEVHFVETSTRTELIQFEAATRTAEAIHLMCVLWNLPAFWLLTVTGSPWLVFAAGMFGLDCYLVLLQRYHRARVWALIKTMVERTEARALSATTHTPVPGPTATAQKGAGK